MGATNGKRRASPGIPWPGSSPPRLPAGRAVERGSWIFGTWCSIAGASIALSGHAVGVGHCDFTPAEVAQGFVDPVAWTEAGVKPGGDDFLDPANVASTSFGRSYTDGSHLLGTPCP